MDATQRTLEPVGSGFSGKPGLCWQSIDSIAKSCSVCFDLVWFYCFDEHDTPLHFESDIDRADHDTPILIWLAILSALVSRARILCQCLVDQTPQSKRTGCHEIAVLFKLV